MADIKEQFAFKPACIFSPYGERLTSYRPGGYHPVSLGDTFKDGRYVVARKLGWGDTSTVWLVRDVFLDRWVALKILMAELSTSRQPVAATKALRRHKDTAELMPALYDSFFHEGPSGVHMCLVMELLGPTLGNLIMYFTDMCDRIHPEDVLRLTRQILSGVATFHGAGFARGNLGGPNLVFTIRNLVDDDALFEALGEELGEEPLTMELVRKDGAPLAAHMPRQFPDMPSWDSWVDEDEEDLRFVGVDRCFRTTDRMPSSDAVRCECPAPEVLFEETFVEGLPPEWEPAWRCIRATSPPPPEHLLHRHSPTVNLEQSFKNKVPDPELTQLLPVIRGLLRLRPQDRISARQALALLL
ncbi:srpk domain protein [Beauveria brongniartii RCEF 3172]|uniref:non-specific serine/threonine protein kinase n=1 Tax=Beauveria brongniartii RCEF 3172 TaxID=1081107 RepID=A0A166Y662_9HYPO|nr:srpk domain protein [Beauveria brongniartii RCEF 3172]